MPERGTVTAAAPRRADDLEAPVWLLALLTPVAVFGWTLALSVAWNLHVAPVLQLPTLPYRAAFGLTLIAHLIFRGRVRRNPITAAGAVAAATYPLVLALIAAIMHGVWR